MNTRALVTLSLSTSLAFSIPAWPETVDPQNLSETIQGEVKNGLDIRKPPPSIRLDVKDIVESGTAQTDSVLQGARPIPSDQDFAHYQNADSSQVIRPWNPLLPEPPLVTFYPGLSKVASNRWEFRVSDERGDVVKVLAGKGIPPKKVDWDGLDEKGRYIRVGTLYSYQFVTFDEHENAHTFAGEPFQIDALMYRQKRKLIVEFASDKLFQDDQAVLRASMSGFWDRAVDVVREHSNHPVSVEVYSARPSSPLAEKRRQTAVSSLSEATNIPAADIRHKVDKADERGDVTRLVMSLR